MQTPSKKRITKDVKDDATQQGHKRSKCSNNGGTTAMQTEMVEAATHQKVISAPIQRRLSPPAFNSSRNNNIILSLRQPCSPNDNNLSKALAAGISTPTNNNSVHTTHHRDNNHQSEIFRCLHCYVAAIKARQLGLKTACVEMRGSLGE